MQQKNIQQKTPILIRKCFRVETYYCVSLIFAPPAGAMTIMVIAILIILFRDARWHFNKCINRQSTTKVPAGRYPT